MWHLLGMSSADIAGGIFLDHRVETPGNTPDRIIMVDDRPPVKE